MDTEIGFLSESPENNRLVRMVWDTDWSYDDKCQVALAVQDRTVRWSSRKNGDRMDTNNPASFSVR